MGADISDYENEFLVNKKLALDKAAMTGKSTWAFDHGRQQIQITAERLAHGKFKTHVVKLGIERNGDQGRKGLG